MTYLLFPVNVLLGVLLGVWRMAITALFNIVHLGRTDISLLNRSVEAFDPGEPRPQVGPALCSHTHTHTHRWSATRPHCGGPSGPLYREGIGIEL